MTGKKVDSRRGTKLTILEGLVYHLVGEEKLAKAWIIFHKWLHKVGPDQLLYYNDFLSDRVFLIYLFDTNKNFSPFLKEIYLTLYSWWPYCDSEGWNQEPDYILEGNMA